MTNMKKMDSVDFSDDLPSNDDIRPMPESSSDVSTGILLSTLWSQGGILDLCYNRTITYNEYTPLDPNNSKHCVTGCTNTAAAQIIYYFIEKGLLDFSLTLNADDAYDAAYIVRSVGGYGGVVTSFFFSIVAAMTVFGWMYNPKSAGFTGSLPIRREGLFLSCAGAGFTMLACPAVVTALLILVGGAGSCGFAAAAALALEWLGKFLLLCLCFFGFSCLCAFLTGTMWVLPVVYGLLNVAVAGFWALIASVLRLLLPGFGGGLPMLAADLSPVVRAFLFDWGETYFPDWLGLVLYAIFGLVCAFLGLVLMKKRRMETATDTVALDWLKPVFRWIFAAGFALCFANLIYLILMSEERYHYAVMGVLLVLGGFLGWFIAEMLVRKSYKVGSCFKTYPILAVLLVVLVLFCAAGGLGYSAYCPDAARVESATLTVPGYSCTTDDPAEIEVIRSIHREMAEERVPGSDYDSIQVVYRLQDGKNVSRSFPREALSAEGKEECRRLVERQLLGGLEKMLTEGDLLLNTGVDCYTGEDWHNFALEDAESRVLLQRGILADAAAGNLSLVDSWFFRDGTEYPEEGYYSLSLQSWRKRAADSPKGPGAWDDPYDGAYYGITVTPEAKNTWALLEQFEKELGAEAEEWDRPAAVWEG